MPKGVHQRVQGLIRLAVMQHQSQTGRSLRNGWRADGNGENPCCLQPLLVLQRWLITPHQQRQDRPNSNRGRPDAVSGDKSYSDAL